MASGHNEPVPSRTWKDLSPRSRRLIAVGASIDAGLRLAALVDLWRRPPETVRGRRSRWALALAVVNSAGILPLAYFRFGRRSAD